MPNENRTSPAAGSPRRGRFVASQALVWCVAVLLIGIAAARVSVWVEQVAAPLLIFPLMFGCVLGLLLVVLMRLAQIGHRPTLVAGTVLAALTAIVAQHYFSYRDARAAILASNKTGLSALQFAELAPPAAASFAGYMRRQAAVGRPLYWGGSKTPPEEHSLRGAAAWASWAIDGLLVLAAAVSIVFILSRSPYCSVCRSWYRTVRGGCLTGDRAASVATAASLPIDEPISAARYRLLHCGSGCGPARLELTWNGPQGHVRQAGTWLRAAEREAMARALDEETAGD